MTQRRHIGGIGSNANDLRVVKVDHVNHQPATSAAPGASAILSIYYHGNTAGWFCSRVDGKPPTNPRVTDTRFSFLPVSASKSEYGNLTAKSSVAFTPAGDKHHDALGNPPVTLLKRSRRQPPFLPVRIRSRRSCIGGHTSSGRWLIE